MMGTIAKLYTVIIRASIPFLLATEGQSNWSIQRRSSAYQIKLLLLYIVYNSLFDQS